ncbi:MAG: TadE/TadG family type IV pilus assembly protein [Pseudomonadota bacterium]
MYKIHRFHWRNIRGFWRAESGISAVEFALIAPVMMLFYFGSIELSFMMTLDRKVTSTAGALGDLVARADSIDNAEMIDIFDASRTILEPYPADVARMRVSSLVREDGTVTVAWSDGLNLTALPVGQQVTVPSGLVSDGDSLILAEVEYDYESFLGYFYTEKKKLSDEFYLRPRRTNTVERDRQ